MINFRSRKSITDALAIIHDYQVTTDPDNAEFPINGHDLETANGKVMEESEIGPYLSRLNAKRNQEGTDFINEAFEPWIKKKNPYLLLGPIADLSPLILGSAHFSQL